LPAGPAAPRSIPIDWLTVLLFGFGVARLLEVKVMGTLFGTDLAVLATLPFALRRLRNVPLGRDFGRVMVFWALWMVSAVVTDMVRETPIADALRGGSKVAMFGVTLFVVAVLSEFKAHRLTAFMCGLAVATIVGVIFMPTPYQVGQPWKFGLGWNAGLLACALAMAMDRLGLRPRWVRLVPLIAVALICLDQGARSLFGTLILAIAGVVAADLLGPTLRRVRLGLAVWIGLIVLGAAGAGSILAAYSGMASHGLLGEEAERKYEMQTVGGGGIVLGGRGEVMVSSQAILRSPIIGHGSWAQEAEYKIMLVSMLRQRGVNATLEFRTGAGIPSHSYFFQSWVEHGFLGGLFWAVVLVLTARSIPDAMRSGHPATPVYFLAVFSLLWSIPFTPFGAENRFFAAGEMAFAFWALRQGQAYARPPAPGRDPARTAVGVSA